MHCLIHPEIPIKVYFNVHWISGKSMFSDATQYNDRNSCDILKGPHMPTSEPIFTKNPSSLPNLKVDDHKLS